MHIRWNCGASQKMVSLRLCPIQNVFSLVHFRKGSILWCFIQWLISCYQHHQGMPSLYGTFTSNRNWLVRPSSSYLLQCSSNQYYCFFYWRAALTSHEDVIQSLSWKIDGGAMVTTCKDRKVRIVDPRCADAVSLAAESHSSNNQIFFFQFCLPATFSTPFSYGRAILFPGIGSFVYGAMYQCHKSWMFVLISLN